MTTTINRKAHPTSQLVYQKRDWSMVGNEKIRIVAFDDDTDILDLVRMSLGETYEVVVCSDPMKAGQMLELVEPELVILDVMMPKVTGYQIAETIRRTPALQHTLILFLSAKDQPRDVKYGYKIGANFYVTKPFQPERLQRTVDALIKEHYPSGRPRPKTHPIGIVRTRLLAASGPANPWAAMQAQQLLGVPNKPAESAPQRPGNSSTSRLPKAPASGADTKPPAASILPPEDPDPDADGSGIGRKNWVG